MKLSAKLNSYPITWKASTIAAELAHRDEENEQLKSRVKELEMVEQKYSKYIHIAWYAIEEAGYENHDLDLKKFMQGE